MFFRLPDRNSLSEASRTFESFASSAIDLISELAKAAFILSLTIYPEYLAIIKTEMTCNPFVNFHCIKIHKLIIIRY